MKNNVWNENTYSDSFGMQGVFEKYEIPIADKTAQDEYAKFVKGINKKQRKIQDELSELSSQRQTLMDKYFS